MSTYERDRLNVNGDTVNLRDAGAVRFDRAQSLTAAQQAQARDNIGAGTGTGGVTGVKGSAENDYRTGQVNITPANIGLGNVDNTSDADKPVSTAQQAALDDKADVSDIVAIEQKLDSASAYGEVGPVPVTDISDALPLDAAKLVIDIEPVQSGSGDPSPDNIRPITGWTGAKVTRCGKNLLQTPYYDSSKTEYGVTFTVNNDGSVSLSGTNNRGSTMYYGFVNRNFPKKLKKGKYFVGRSGIAGGTFSIVGVSADNTQVFALAYATETSDKVFTLSEDTLYYSYLAINAGVTVNATFYPRLELGSTATDYEPYQGDIYNITFPSEAGTVYGGTLDVVNGVLTVDRGNIASYAGETLPGAWISSMDVYTVGGTPTTGAQVVYDLATPIAYQLTPQQVTMLQGDNTVFADCGDTTVGYWRDDSLSINKAITERAQVGSGCPSGTFTTADGKTVTVTNGFITAITP